MDGGVGLSEDEVVALIKKYLTENKSAICEIVKGCETADKVEPINATIDGTTVTITNPDGTETWSVSPETCYKLKGSGASRTVTCIKKPTENCTEAVVTISKAGVADVKKVVRVKCDKVVDVVDNNKVPNVTAIDVPTLSAGGGSVRVTATVENKQNNSVYKWISDCATFDDATVESPIITFVNDSTEQDKECEICLVVTNGSKESAKFCKTVTVPKKKVGTKPISGYG